MDTVDFGTWLQMQLDRKGWTQAELAKRMNAYNSLISKWIHNTQKPRPELCRRIADALGIDPDDVLAAAGHRVIEDEPGVLHHEARTLVNRIPEDLLILAIPTLGYLADPANHDSIRSRLAK